MKPFDPRLLRYAKATRGYLAFLLFCGLADTALIAAQIILIANAVSPIFYGEKSPTQVLSTIGWLAVAFAARFVVNYIRQAFGHRSALRVIADLRSQVLHHATNLGERWGNTTNTVTLVTRGLDDLEAYFVQFLPQLLLTVTAMPALLILLFFYDWIAGCFVVACIPLVPLFMILIGKMTARYSSERLKAMSQLSAQLLDLLAGLATLKGLGREKGPETRVAKLGDTFAQKTLQTLYVAFLSGAALEFLTTLSTALVAVNIGLRMVGGSIPLATGLITIMITPEIFKPLREVGTQFHASSNGVAAAERAFEVLEQPAPAHTGARPVPADTTIEIRNLSVYAPGRATVAPHQLTATIRPGEVTVLRGASGSGKSTTVQVLAGLLEASEGEVRVGGIPLKQIDRAAWWQQITWVPQRPAIIPGTVEENVGSPSAERERAAELTGFAQVVDSLPSGWHTQIGHGGTGLSVGQRQRLALTRALLSSRPIVVLDEPSAHLDAMSEEYVSQTVRELKASGHTVIVIAHRQAIVELADAVVDVVPAVRDISAELTRAATLKSAAQLVQEKK